MQIVAAVILVWLWNYHEDDFQRAFAKSGRIDVDLTCKWLVQAAVDTAVRALTMYLTGSGKASGARASKADSAAKEPIERSTENSTELMSAIVVCRSLSTESLIDADIVSIAPCLPVVSYVFDLQ